MGTAASLFKVARLTPQGSVRWSEPITSRRPGVYVVEAPAPSLFAPFSMPAIEAWLERVPGIRVDGAPTDARALRKRLDELWIPSETVVYIGRAGTDVGGRVRAYYRTPLGDPRPHAGGHWLKTLSAFDQFRVWWAESDDPVDDEASLLWVRRTTCRRLPAVRQSARRGWRPEGPWDHTLDPAEAGRLAYCRGSCICATLERLPELVIPNGRRGLGLRGEPLPRGGDVLVLLVSPPARVPPSSLLGSPSIGWSEELRSLIATAHGVVKMRTQTRLTLASLMAAAVLTVSTTGAAPRVTAGESVSADFNPESIVSDNVLERERRLLPTVDALSELPGFQVGGLDPDLKVDGVFVYWNGEFGQEAQDVIEGAKRQGIAVNVIPVSYSYDELRKIAGPLMDALAAKGIMTEGYTIGDPFDEIAMWGGALDKSAEVQRLAEDTAAKVLPHGLKLAIVAPPDNPVFADSRHSDGGQPTPGDGFLAAGGHCTSALGWEDPGFRFYMESAAHCVGFANNVSVAFEGNPYNAGTYSGFMTTLFGSATAPNDGNSSDWLLDATLIGVPATPSIAGEMFTGSNTSSTKVDIPSIGAMVLNVTYCANGAATGTHCNLGRSSSGWSRINFCLYDPPYCYLDVVPVTSLNQTLLFGQGDSGGNVYRQSDRRVVATITAMEGATYYCGSANYYSSTALCTSYGGWVTEVTKVKSELAETNADLVPRLRP